MMLSGRVGAVRSPGFRGARYAKIFLARSSRAQRGLSCRTVAERELGGSCLPGPPRPFPVLSVAVSDSRDEHEPLLDAVRTCAALYFVGVTQRSRTVSPSPRVNRPTTVSGLMP